MLMQHIGIEFHDLDPLWHIDKLHKEYNMNSNMNSNMNAQDEGLDEDLQVAN
jgi:hypothetical protein